MDEKKVSVIMATYNCSETIEKAVKSVLNQTYKNIELIIIDDASTDNTLDILKGIYENNFIIIKNSDNIGKYQSINTGINKSSGYYITICDADDYYVPYKIEKQVKCMLSNSNLVACLHPMMRIKPNSNYKITSQYAEISLMFIKHIIIDKIGYYDSMRFGADTEFKKRLIRVFGKDRIGYIDEILYIAIIRENSLTTTPETRINGPLRMYYSKRYNKWHKTSPNLYIGFPLITRPF